MPPVIGTSRQHDPVCSCLPADASLGASEWLPPRSAVTGRVCETKYRTQASKRGVTQKQETHAAGLMLRAQQGEEEAYAELLVLLTAATRSYIRSRVGPLVPWIDDAVQETLVAVHHARHTFDGRRPFAPWFYAIAHQRCGSSSPAVALHSGGPAHGGQRRGWLVIVWLTT
jgi:hypothetical protein